MALGRGQETTQTHRGLSGGIFSVPARFMQPRLILLVSTFALLAFGLVMIFSSSSIVALSSTSYDNNPAYFLIRQLIFVVVGLGIALATSHVNYHNYQRYLAFLAIFIIVLLILPKLPGIGSSRLGAERWIQIGPMTLQPSEFVKASVIIFTAEIITRDDLAFGSREFLILSIAGIGAPLLLTFLQPDKGTTIIMLVGILAMVVVARYYHKLILIGSAFVFSAVGIIAWAIPYSRDRIETFLSIGSDPYGQDYQLLQGFYAFANGGLFGVGLGNSTQKYAYLPMAYNDFIFAIIGEELGVAGILLMLCLFGLFSWAALEIAYHADDMKGRVIVVGALSMIIFQAFLNMLGVTGGAPLSGKPIPFISYGGSSVWGSLLLVGLIWSVSRFSKLPETQADRRRQDWAVTSAPRAARDMGVGEARPRPARPRFEVIENPNLARRQPRGDARPKGREVRDSATGRRRIDLGPTATERLRGRDSK